MLFKACNSNIKLHNKVGWLYDQSPLAIDFWKILGSPSGFYNIDKV